MGAQISTNLISGCSSDIRSKADLGRYINYANKSTLMVINFTTTWCQPCKDAEPPMRKLADEFPDVKFARVDIDLLQDVVTEFDLKTMPTFLLCKKVDDGPDKGNGAPEVGGGNGSGNRISSANNVKEGNSAVPSATQGKRTTGITEGTNVVSSASEGKSATNVKEGNSRAAGATGGKSGTGVERANSPAVSGLNGESTTANAKKNGDGVTAVKEGNSVPSPKRRAVNYEGKKVFIDEIDRMEGPLEVHELRKKITRVNGVSSEKEIIPTIFKSTDDFYRYLGESKPTQLMVINFTAEWWGPCKKADETFKKLSKVYEDVQFAKVDVDVDALMKIAEYLDVKMMPTFLLVKVKKLEKEHVKKKLEKEHVKKDGVQGDHKKKKEPPEKEYVTEDGVQGDHKEKKEPPKKELVKKDGVQGDHKVKKIPPENARYERVELDRLVGWNDNTEGELRKMIEKHTGTLQHNRM